MGKGLRTKLQFDFQDQEEFEDLNYNIPLKIKGINKKVQVVKMKKRNKRRDASTNTELF